MNPELACKQSLRHARCPASRRMWRFAAAVCVAALTVSFVGCTKGDLRPSQQVLLEAAASAGQSPWMESVSSANVPTEVSRVEQAPSTAAAETQDDTVKVSGDQVGLYGGTPGVAACDREKMVKFLETHSPQATAWKNVTGAKDIRSYAQTLSPVVLTHDTRVTNHGFKNGQASPFQSVLETGTPVLIDDRGVPRVRCACGNPLAEPQSATKQEFSGSAWRTFKKTSLVTVQQSVKTLDKVELVSVPVTDAPPPVTPFAAISPGETTPKPAPETVLPPGAILVPAGGSSSPATPSVNSGSDTNTTTTTTTPTTTTTTTSTTTTSTTTTSTTTPSSPTSTSTPLGEEPAQGTGGENNGQSSAIPGESSGQPSEGTPQLPFSIPQLPPLIDQPS